MRILHLSTHDVVGGAAMATRRLHEGLLRAGVDSSMLVLHRGGEDPTVRAFVPPGDGLSRLRRGWARLRARAAWALGSPRGVRPIEPIVLDRSPAGLGLADALPEHDVLLLHWVSHFVDYLDFFPRVAGRRPILWRLPDMTALTGGCHYARDCRRFTGDGACGQCPLLAGGSRGDVTHQTWRRKHRALAFLRDEDVTLVCQNAWMAGEAAASSLMGRFDRQVIPNGVDDDVFTPWAIDAQADAGDRAGSGDGDPATRREASRQAARRRLGLDLPAGARVVMFAAVSVKASYKGPAQLEALLSSLARAQADNAAADSPNGPDEPIHLLTVGAGGGELDLPWPATNLGYVTDANRLADAYRAADVFVITSEADNQPNTVLEAMACATPVAGFAVGGVAEMVDDGVTGVIAPAGDAPALARGLSAMLADRSLRQRMGQAARKRIEARFTRAGQIARYVALCQRLLDDFKPRASPSR